MTDDELRSLVADYTDEWWARWRHFARSLYGPRAHHVRIAVDRPHDDGLVPDATVYAIDGTMLEPDLELPWWRRLSQDYSAANLRQDAADRDPRWWEERTRSYIWDTYGGWSKDDAPQILPVYRPPSRTADILYVAADEGLPPDPGDVDERLFPPPPLLPGSDVGDFGYPA